MNGGLRCAASPASSTRPLRQRSATWARNVYSTPRTNSTAAGVDRREQPGAAAPASSGRRPSPPARIRHSQR